MRDRIPSRKNLNTVIGPGRVEEFKLCVNYDQDFSSMIAEGRYDWVNPNITPEHFPNHEKGKGRRMLTARLEYFGRLVSFLDIAPELYKKCLRPGTFAELLAFGAALPEVQRRFPILAPGSVSEFSDRRYVVLLDQDHKKGYKKRYLDLDLYAGLLPENHRLLVFRA